MKGWCNMEVEKISSKGQITIPITVRNRLNLKAGFSTEEEMQDYMKEIRREIRGYSIF